MDKFLLSATQFKAELPKAPIQYAVNESLLSYIVKPSDKLEAIFNQNESLSIKDAYDITPAKFGVISHVDSTFELLSDALKGIETLRSEFNLATNKKSVIAKSQTFINKVVDSKYITLVGIPADYWDSYQFNSVIFESKKKSDTTKVLQIRGIADLTELKDNEKSSALFSTGASVRTDIRNVEVLRGLLTQVHTKLNKALTDKKNQLAKIDAEIPVQHRTLANLNQERVKQLGDYQVVRALVAENWAEVEQAYRKREEILTNNQGIYYARVRETPFNLSPVVDLPLRHGRLEDLVPGYPLEDAELPEDIANFIEAVIEIPIANWTVFNNQWYLLPPRNNILRLLGQRKVRLDYRVSLGIGASKFNLGRLDNIRASHQSLVQDQARFSYQLEASLLAFQRESARVLSLEDLLNGPPHKLRGLAQNFRNKIDQATHSLLIELRKVQPSIRLDWAEAAELDQLDLRRPHQWPGLDRAEAKDLNGIRTMIELVNWWWRQLNPDATSASVTAVRNLLRAILLVAAADDPDQILQGQLQTVPANFRLGDLLRVSLNREATPGTLLQLVDTNNLLVGTLRVDDADDKGVITTLTKLHNSQTIATPSSQFTVTGFVMPGINRS